jgi:hypothetical protein
VNSKMTGQSVPCARLGSRTILAKPIITLVWALMIGCYPAVAQVGVISSIPLLGITSPLGRGSGKHLINACETRDYPLYQPSIPCTLATPSSRPKNGWQCHAITLRPRMPAAMAEEGGSETAALWRRQEYVEA